MRDAAAVTERPWNDLPRLHVADIELPDEVERLYDLAYNLWWTWSPRARELFSAVDSRSWSLYRNPVQLLINVDRPHWQEKLEDDSFRKGLQMAIDGSSSEDIQKFFDTHMEVAEQEHEQAGGHGVEGAAVADLAQAEVAADAVDDIVRGHARGLARARCRGAR